MHDCHTGNSNGRCLFCIMPGSMSCCAIPHLDNSKTKVCQDWSGKSSAFCMHLLVCSDQKTRSCYKTMSASQSCCMLILASVATVSTAASGHHALQVIWQLPMEPLHCWTTSPAWTPQRWPRPKLMAPSFWLTATWLSGPLPMPSPLAQVGVRYPCFALLTQCLPPPFFLLFSHALSPLPRLLLHSAKAVYQVSQQPMGHLF